MGWALVFQELAAKKADDGVIFAVTPSNRMMELFFYARTLIKVRSRQFSGDQLDRIFREGSFEKATFSAMAINPDRIEPEVIERFFPYYAAEAISPDRTVPRDRVRLIRLMGYLSGLGSVEGSRACAVMADRVQLLHPEFSLDRGELQNRIAHAPDRIGLNPDVLNAADVPDNPAEVIGWVFRHRVATDPLMEAIFLHYLFFGEAFARIYPAVVRRSGMEEKSGFARILLPVDLQVPAFRSVVLYRDRDFLIQLPAHAQRGQVEKKPVVLTGEAHMASAYDSALHVSAGRKSVEVALTPQDIGTARLQVGGGVNVVFLDEHVV